MAALGMDGFYLTSAELVAMPDPGEAHARRGAPWTFAPDKLRGRLRALGSAEGRKTVAWPDFRHDVGDPIEAGCIVPPETRILLVEGIYLLHDADGWQGIAECFDERWYLDTPLETAMERVAARHVAKMKYGARVPELPGCKERLTAPWYGDKRDRPSSVEELH